MSEHLLDNTQSTGAAAQLGKIPGVAVMASALIIVFAIIAPGFATTANVNNVLVQSVVLLLMALPMTLIIMTEGIDLSMGAVLTLLTIVYALMVLATGSLALALLATILAGVVCGSVNGWLVAVSNIPPFVVTLGTLGVAQGLALVVSDGQSVVGLPRAIQFAYSGLILGIPVPLVIAAAGYAVIHFLLYRTPFGIYIPALGGNRDALKQAGVNDRLVLIGVYALAGIMLAIAAPVLCGRMNAAHPSAALGLEFDAIAAVAVGGTQFDKGNGWIFGTLLGVIAIGVLRNGLNLMAVSSSVQIACVGLLVILALLIDGFRSRAP